MNFRHKIVFKEYILKLFFILKFSNRILFSKKTSEKCFQEVFFVQIIAIDPDKEAYQTGVPFIKKAGVENKINFIQSDAMLILNDLIVDVSVVSVAAAFNQTPLNLNGCVQGNEEGTLDFAFVDADKENYLNYHELLLKLVRVGGIIAYDNTLWFGSVARSKEEEMMDFERAGRVHIMKLNKFLASDPRVELSHLSMGDGVALCRRLY